MTFLIPDLSRGRMAPSVTASGEWVRLLNFICWRIVLTLQSLLSDEKWFQTENTCTSSSEILKAVALASKRVRGVVLDSEWPLNRSDFSREDQQNTTSLSGGGQQNGWLWCLMGCPSLRCSANVMLVPRTG